MNETSKGITLIALTITIIILLILVGVSLIIMHHSIIDKAIVASNNTIEAILKEKIEMALIDIKSSYLMEKENGLSITKEQYVQNKLEDLDEVNQITVTSTSDGMNISLSYNNDNYNFHVSQKGNVTLLQSLKENVKIGDYVEYPIEYVDICSGENYTASNGWRVIDDGKMKGTSGSVKIISNGVPAKWHYNRNKYETNQLAVENLKNNFENLDLLNDYEHWIQLKGTDFIDTRFATKITTISLKDINYVYNEIYGTNRKLNDTTLLDDKYEIFDLKNRGIFSYWIASAKEDSAEEIYFISNQGIELDSYIRMGVRPVIYLKDDLIGTFHSGVWEINGEEK